MRDNVWHHSIMAFLDEDTSILSKNVGQGGAGVYVPAAYEYGSKAALVSGGKRKRRRTKRRRTSRRNTKRRGTR